MTRYNREDSRTVLPQLEEQTITLQAKVQELQNGLSNLQVEEITISYTVSTGTVTTISAYKVGQIVFFEFNAKNSSAVDPGDTIANATLTSYLPLHRTIGNSFNGGKTIGARITTAGDLLVQNTSGSSFPANNNAYCTLVYLSGE